MQRPRAAVLVPLAVLAVAVEGCGSSNSSSSTSAARSAGSNSGGPSAQGASGGAATLPSNTGGAASSTTVTIAADPTGQLKFDKSSLTAKEGTLTINFTNQTRVGHNFTIEQNGKKLAATPTFEGGTKTLKVGLRPGTYTFLCTVAGHAAAGMKGTLTIT